MNDPNLPTATSGETGVSAALHQAPDELAQVKDQAKERARDLAGEARTELRRQADEQTTRVVDGIRRTTVQLETMADANPDPESPVAEAVRQLARVSDRAGSRLEERGIDGLTSDLTSYARQHPGTFLGVAFGVGILVGRVLRSDIEHRRSDEYEGAADRAAGQVPGVPGQPEIDLRADPVAPVGVPAPSHVAGATPEPIGVIPGGGAV